MIPVRTLAVITHIAAWKLFLSLPVLFVTGQSGYRDFFSTLASSNTWLFFITYIFIFYLNTWFLLPQLYLKKRFFLYAAAIIVLLVAVWMVKPFDRLVNRRHNNTAAVNLRAGPPQENFKQPPPFEPSGKPQGPLGGLSGRRSPKVDIVSIFLFIMILAMSLAIQIRQRLRYAEQRTLRAETDKANAELSFLKRRSIRIFYLTRLIIFIPWQLLKAFILPKV